VTGWTGRARRPPTGTCCRPRPARRSGEPTAAAAAAAAVSEIDGEMTRRGTSAHRDDRRLATDGLLLNIPTTSITELQTSDRLN